MPPNIAGREELITCASRNLDRDYEGGPRIWYTETKRAVSRNTRCRSMSAEFHFAGDERFGTMQIMHPRRPKAKWTMRPQRAPFAVPLLVVLGLGLATLLDAGSARAATSSGSSRYQEPYPTAASKKGLQVEMVEDALDLGVKHAALNLNLAELVDLQQNTNNPGWDSDGRSYRFQRAYLETMDRQIKVLSDHQVLVNIIVLVYEGADPAVNRLVLHPNYSTNAPNHLGAFNTVTEDGRRWFTACLEFLSERWSRPDRQYGRVAGYIMGNEVNSHWWWSNLGRATMEEFADDYLRTVSLAHAAIRSQSSWARVYLSLEHHWNIRFGAGDDHQAFAGRPFLDYFAKRAKAQGDFDWSLAFHPYPENLFEPRFWLDKTATTNRDTPRITFKNLPMLTDYLRQPELLYHGAPRHVILSEQGFHTPQTPEGQTIQAAAYCYAYKLVERLPGIDAFILHRHVDNAGEGGLLLGLRSNQPSPTDPRPKKRIYDCFRAADTPGWEKSFEFALPVIGLKSWAEAQ